jgi:hypothetical protein
VSFSFLFFSLSRVWGRRGDERRGEERRGEERRRKSFQDLGRGKEKEFCER